MLPDCCHQLSSGGEENLVMRVLMAEIAAVFCGRGSGHAVHEAQAAAASEEVPEADRQGAPPCHQSSKPWLCKLSITFAMRYAWQCHTQIV